MAMGYHAKDYSFVPTALEFETKDARLQEMFDKGEAFLRGNEITYQDKRVIKEGAVYNNIWLETQPMGGEMYAKRNVEVGLNNVLYFMLYQRQDGRLPGMISNVEKKGIVAHYNWMQGYYFAQPALKLWYLIGKDTGYLQKLYRTLKEFDAYLWAVRDSDGDGCLETWCVWDTGEDNCTRFTELGAPNGPFGGETPPKGIGKLPYESMEYMAYSYANRDVLCKVSSLLNNGDAALWREKAEEIRKKVAEYLWIDEKHACYDRDCNNEFLDCLTHINFRCMYHGLFSQKMADDFLYYHLFNPEEFWTPYPLTAIAINDPMFYNHPHNNWSGPCQGLIYQRSIDALHNYGHYAEALQVGRKLLELICKTGVFYQQYDPFTGEPGDSRDGYGPIIFAFTEYISFLWGVNISMDEVSWSNAVGGADSQYTQTMFGKKYALTRRDGQATASVDGKVIFSLPEGMRVITDTQGNFLRAICIDIIEKATLTMDGKTFNVSPLPNEVYALENDDLTKIGGAKYFEPGKIPRKN